MIKNLRARTALVLVGCLAVMMPLAVFSQKNPAKKTLVIKLASLAPEATPWGAALNELALAWSKATGGDVELRVYHNGMAGSEEDVLRKLKQNQLQAAVFTSLGMSQVSPAIMTLSVPFFIRTDAELNAVLGAIRGDLEAGIEQAGFKTIAWSKIGWVNFFSRNPVFTPQDLKKQKLASDSTLTAFNDAFSSMGYQLVLATSNDIIMFLNSRRIDALYQSPINVATTQAFGIAKNMANIKVAPFMGGIVMNDVTWRHIPEKYRSRLLALSAKTVANNEASIGALEDRAITEMKKHGLVVNDLTDAQREEWYADVNRVIPSLLGKTFDRDIYQKIDGILKTTRSAARR
ncbi:MAG: TRAP transporter substrate-binding protein DctP [Spirochaetaceae bacterium]|jgi:TRAP-type C4-dicarboxylate transport system substrate-binding protein|nr:TRAP transporter substrate-binding protein DctP [Spirochaetaceae bacterium]